MAEAEKMATVEQALRENHEDRVIEAEQELQEAVKKCETLEQSLSGKVSELSQARQAASDAFSMQSVYLKGENQVVSLNSDFSRGICGAAAQHI